MPTDLAFNEINLKLKPENSNAVTQQTVKARLQEQYLCVAH